VVSGCSTSRRARLVSAKSRSRFHRGKIMHKIRPSRWPSWCDGGRWESPLRSPARRSMTFVVAVVDDDRGSSSPSKTSRVGRHVVRLFRSATALLEVALCGNRLFDLRTSAAEHRWMELQRLAHAARPELPVILITGQDYPTRPGGPSGSRAFLPKAVQREGTARSRQ